MTRTAMLFLTAIAVCLNVFAASPTVAQPAHGTTQQSETSQHHQRLYAIMKDMTQEMTKMAEGMSRGPLAPEQRADMAQKMDRMSQMMHRMSGLAARPAMSDPESQKQMDEMRKQMDEMKRDRSMQPGAK